MPASNRFFAVFIGIMGFAAAIDALKEDEHNDLEAMLRGGEDGQGRAPRAVRLSHFFEHFHARVNKLAWKFRLVNPMLITFSDSAYFVTPDQIVAQQFAIDMIAYCYKRHTPLRVGIDYGNFTRLEFSIQNRPFDSLVAASPFLGSSIVRAYRAQRCKAQGFRIFVHPSVTDSCGPPWLYDDLSESEKSPDATRELNFLHQLHRTADEMLIALRDMRSGVTDRDVLEHYDASDQAIRRLNEIGSSRGWPFGLRDIDQ